ncbi:relaxase/mobilization nuclease-like protein [Mucilaginibacter gracilis]|uniref:Relaxase/mobilization nuclease-like protein n=1 Tax=Mucilaginibacter gracilis TaxID=423350 RepID=A0A495J061_9SPHI|nr:relaxase/mobilization nuclease domain-containing protein [Mucilaginibacter gracilis]RKR82366.1 relaxase/mobilization nuclease-like protein [Mucilaginibacter gracilis]
MVARISTGKSIRAMLYYNENKVGEKEANLIMASGFAGDIESMSVGQKLHRFTHLTQLKPNVKTNALHISLNFHSSEDLSNAKLQQIAAAYMEKIGFSDQPFLVYRHHDAAHQHLHIVTTNITAARERIDLHDIGRKLSEPARKQIEEDFKLIKAESKIFKVEAAIKAADIKKAKYGHLPTKRALSNVITAVTRDYRFTSLAELNAALKCFNVVAMRGEEHTAMFQKKGLMYSLLDTKGNPVGVPIKASAFYTKPTFRNLEVKFELNKGIRKLYKEELAKRIDSLFDNYREITISKFETEARQAGITINFRRSENGDPYGITYVDHKSKTVFNGSDLGKAYSAKGIAERLGNTNRLARSEEQFISRPAQRVSKTQKNEPTTYLKPIKQTNFLTLALAKTQPDYGSGVPRKKKRKKRNQQQQQELTL